MNPAKVTDLDYINFLIGSPNVFTCAEAARVQPLDPGGRPMMRSRACCIGWSRTEAQQHVTRNAGILIVDDTTLDKPYAQQIDLVHRLWSGKDHRVVQGISLVTLLWSDGEHCLPVDYRLYDKPMDGATKKDHFRAMLATASARGLSPRLVAFDSWYGSLENLKTIRSYQWSWLTQLESIRHVDPDRSGNRAVREVTISPAVTIVHLKGYGLVKVFRIVTADGDTE